MKNPLKKRTTPTAAPATAVAPTHPLALNANEGRWFNLISGPIDGWFSFAEHGNPPFGMPVQIAFEVEIPPSAVTPTDPRPVKTALFSGAGIRTQSIDPAYGKESWRCIAMFPDRPPGMLTHWRPLSAPPELNPNRVEF